MAFVLKRFVAAFSMWASGIRISVKRDAELNGNAPFVYCSNHTSYLDVAVIYRIIPFYFVFMGKQELSKVPLFNIFFKDMDITVDRESKIGSHKAFIRAGRDIDKGYSVVIFPEGGIPKQDTPKLHRFKNGAFKLAIDKQIPVVPITFLNNWKIVPHGVNAKKHGGPAIARAVIHKPIETKGMTDKDLVNLRTEVFNIIDKTLKEAVGF